MELWTTHELFHTIRCKKIFQCHLNVGLCLSRIDVINYLFKYVCKGSYRVLIQIRGCQIRYNKISAFQEARYVPHPRPYGDYTTLSLSTELSLLLDSMSPWKFITLCTLEVITNRLLSVEEPRVQSWRNS